MGYFDGDNPNDNNHLLVCNLTTSNQAITWEEILGVRKIYTAIPVVTVLKMALLLKHHHIADNNNS